MQARLCDVCGQICNQTHKGKEYSISVIDWADDSSYGYDMKRKIDLCESCQNKLKLWVLQKGSITL